MSLEKAIQYKKEFRKPFYGSASFDGSCRCHGSCSYCRSNRTIQLQRALGSSEDKLKDFYYEYNGAGDPTDANHDHDDALLKSFGIDPWDFETRRELNI